MTQLYQVIFRINLYLSQSIDSFMQLPLNRPLRSIDPSLKNRLNNLVKHLKVEQTISEENRLNLRNIFRLMQNNQDLFNHHCVKY